MDNDTGLVYYHFRYYDPSLGRFLTPDNLIPGGGDDPQEYNRYAYVNGNPVKYTDPTGHWKTPGWAKGAAEWATKKWHGFLGGVQDSLNPCLKDPSSCAPEPPPCVKNPSSCIKPVLEKAADDLEKIGPKLAALLTVPLLAFNQSAMADAGAFLSSKAAGAQLWEKLKLVDAPNLTFSSSSSLKLPSNMIKLGDGSSDATSLAGEVLDAVFSAIAFMQNLDTLQKDYEENSQYSKGKTDNYGWGQGVIFICAFLTGCTYWAHRHKEQFADFIDGWRVPDKPDRPQRGKPPKSDPSSPQGPDGNPPPDDYPPREPGPRTLLAEGFSQRWQSYRQLNPPW